MQFQPIRKVSKVEVILRLLRMCRDLPIIQQGGRQSAFLVQWRAVKRTVLFNHKMMWSKEGGLLSLCVVINTRFFIQAAEEVFRAVISFPAD